MPIPMGLTRRKYPNTVIYAVQWFTLTLVKLDVKQKPIGGLKKY